MHFGDSGHEQSRILGILDLCKSRETIWTQPLDCLVLGPDHSLETTSANDRCVVLDASSMDSILQRSIRAYASISGLPRWTASALAVGGASDPIEMCPSGLDVVRHPCLLRSGSETRRDGESYEPGVRLGMRRLNRLHGGPSLGRAGLWR